MVLSILAPYIIKRRPPKPSAAQPLSNLRTFGPEGPINLKNPHAAGVPMNPLHPGPLRGPSCHSLFSRGIMSSLDFIEFFSKRRVLSMI